MRRTPHTSPPGRPHELRHAIRQPGNRGLSVLHDATAAVAIQAAQRRQASWHGVAPVHMSVSRFGLAGTAPSSQVWRSRWRARRRPRARAPAAAPRCCRCGSPPRCCLRAEGLPRPCLPHVRRTPDAPEEALQPHMPAFIHMRNTQQHPPCTRHAGIFSTSATIRNTHYGTRHASHASMSSRAPHDNAHFGYPQPRRAATPRHGLRAPAPSSHSALEGRARAVRSYEAAAT